MIDSDRKRTQDRGASSHKEGNFGVCSVICINSILSMTLSCSFKIVNFETMLYNILKGVICYFVSELFKCLWAYCSERKCFRIFEMV